METWSDRKEVFFGLSAIRLIDSPMHLTFKTFLNIHPSLECGRNPITRKGHKERVLFNRFNWNYFPLSPAFFSGGIRAILGIFVTIEVSFFFFFCLIGEKSRFSSLFHFIFFSFNRTRKASLWTRY